MLKGLIFDLDGVITDSARYHLAAWNALAEELGIKLPAKASDELRGLARMDSLELILRYGHQENKYSLAEKEALAAKKNMAYQQAIKKMTQADILPGISELLEQAKTNGLKMAIASASMNAPTILKQLGLLKEFDAVVDPKTLSHGKPNPEIYQKAQALLDLEADEVISFEDAASGVAAIKAAKQFAVGIGDSQVLGQADLVVSDTSQLDLTKIVATFKSKKVG
ncbi:beta-phosphoglucomutase [Lactobacillus jensenii]|jgi:beta-phosphoglucomutase|uniref:Beta-phosphoglucomutase n=2 Tax=Lactobacillus TaxID=1578 RepID=A0A5N1IFF7_LACJE|nr:beta-phosphoglucomutase [Lactobacillus jensenii]ERJ43122.1 beta-phosphoglucomutase [Lactobacillus jensenii MD IIE-70(2)]APT14095.1 beta-phosphoglucomutase [Lactobacillus jensenii]EEQ24242.1 beta-phosphoglucomutase [Lactobacillus jensenii 269-3]EEX26980.1 beta-phosphoglucomutase [Lactobacillus jensenii SJ-7A-US]KAA9234308.1 beta-phosphoglucomutase [Lactobacillus jensenii]